MTRIADFEQMFDLTDEIIDRLQGSTSLEQAAQRTLAILWKRFDESLVLARMFATLPYGQLPAENRTFVDQLTESGDPAHRPGDETPILSLMATRGRQPAWNDRRNSAGHVGIPLVSSDFVASVPMLARLLAEVGLELDWLDDDATGIDFHTLSKRSSVFYVEDARTAVDADGRKIISAEDFVNMYDVRTVFGLGGGFAISRTFITLLFFCSETVPRERALQFLSLMSAIKAAVARVVTQRVMFDEAA